MSNDWVSGYLGESPSYDLALDWNKRKTEEPSKHYSGSLVGEALGASGFERKMT